MTARRIAAAALVVSVAATGGCAAPGWQSAPLPRVAEPSAQPVPVPTYRLVTQRTPPAGWVSVPWQVTGVVRDRVYLGTDTSTFCNAEPRYTLRTDLNSVIIGVYAAPLPPHTLCALARVARLGRPYVQVVGGVDGRRVVHAR